MRTLTAAIVALAGIVPGCQGGAPGAPVITSVGKHLYVSGKSTNFVGVPGVFKLSDPGSAVTKYQYSVDGGTGTVAAGKDGTAELAITPNTFLGLTLTVQAVNKSGTSPVTSFDIENHANGNIATLAWWRLNGHGRAATDATGNDKTAALTGDAAFGCGKTAAPDGYKCSMAISGHGGQALTGSSLLPIIETAFPFTASAWVNMTKCAVSCVALAQDGIGLYQFALSYQRVCTAGGKSGACWKFTLNLGDVASDGQLSIESPPGSAKLGKWTQITGVSDSASQLLALYVNGTAGGSIPMTETRIPGEIGRVRIGNLQPGGKSRDWNGRISDACVFLNALDRPADVKLLFQGDKAHPHDGCAAMFAKYP